MPVRLPWSPSGKKMRDNKNRFALALEREVYADKASDLVTAAESRSNADRVEFIKQCLFKFYQIPEKYQCEVWRSARDEMNTRVRRLRKKRRDMGDVAALQEQTQNSTGHVTSTPCENLRVASRQSRNSEEFDEYYFDDY
ncbi:hypothetical protein Aduo_017076 [Ancylostoma duodenale]